MAPRGPSSRPEGATAPGPRARNLGRPERKGQSAAERPPRLPPPPPLPRPRWLARAPRRVPAPESAARPPGGAAAPPETRALLPASAGQGTERNGSGFSTPRAHASPRPDGSSLPSPRRHPSGPGGLGPTPEPVPAGTRASSLPAPRRAGLRPWGVGRPRPHPESRDSDPGLRGVRVQTAPSRKPLQASLPALHPPCPADWSPRGPPATGRRTVLCAAPTTAAQPWRRASWPQPLPLPSTPRGLRTVERPLHSLPCTPSPAPSRKTQVGVRSPGPPAPLAPVAVAALVGVPPGQRVAALGRLTPGGHGGPRALTHPESLADSLPSATLAPSPPRRPAQGAVHCRVWTGT